MEITGINAVTVEGNFEWPLIKIETDEGISGYGEVRDHSLGHVHKEAFYADTAAALALDLEPVLLGKDPTNIIGRVEELRPYGGRGRLGGGVSAIEMALFDIAGKRHGVPAYQLLGGKYRDEIRVYVDCRAGQPVTDSAESYRLDANDYAPEDYAAHAKRREAQGFDFLKFDLDPRVAKDVTGKAGIRGTQLTAAGLEYLEDVVAAIRGSVSSDTDIGFDCAAMQRVSVADAIKFGRILDEYNTAIYEDAVSDGDVTGWTELSEAIDTPTITGEDLFGVDGFRELIRNDAIDIVGPDLLTAGGIRETVRISDFANQHGIPANLHFAASPVGFMASIHAAAAIPDLMAVEFHAVGVPWWSDLVERPDTLFEDGYATVPDAPGLGIEFDNGVVAEHALEGRSFE
ncbi:mandelate racemase/muconate lactonizing enzyme family protein [Halobacteria archaeon AArc-m2/3/4]|uniref:Mandelate racemase/muconate lactonizing enzyme family protein n=1 Tax=Natronoglomus mannanivorans TaxID=2979990 RepID=A0ABT2QKL0_9EURY|nr:mandelate racemase/muconate lactonizing enzyme family protein [Halobacteria archaeon AArc-m2/3/4]